MTKIRVIDFETTGLEPPAEVVEVGRVDLMSQSDASWVIGEPQSWLCEVKAMPPEVRAVHHISMGDAAGFPAFSEDELIADVTDVAVIAAHNWDFEKKWLPNVRTPAICTYKAALRVWPEAPSHSNGALRYWLEDKGLVALDAAKTYPPHRAGPDAYVTAHLLTALLKSGATGKEMVAWTKEPRVFPTCPIGDKWRGKPWSEVDGGFLGWMLRHPTMEEDLKWNAQREIARRSEGHTQ